MYRLMFRRSHAPPLRASRAIYPTSSIHYSLLCTRRFPCRHLYLRFVFTPSGLHNGQRPVRNESLHTIFRRHSSQYRSCTIAEVPLSVLGMSPAKCGDFDMMISPSHQMRGADGDHRDDSPPDDLSDYDHDVAG